MRVSFVVLHIRLKGNDIVSYVRLKENKFIREQGLWLGKGMIVKFVKNHWRRVFCVNSYKHLFFSYFIDSVICNSLEDMPTSIILQFDVLLMLDRILNLIHCLEAAKEKHKFKWR